MERRSLACFFLILFTAIGFSLPAFSQEQLTISTYYPSPYGVYNKLRLFPQGSNPNGTACAVAEGGTLQYFPSSIYYCNGTIWTPLVSGTNWWADDASGTNTIVNTNSGSVRVGSAPLTLDPLLFGGRLQVVGKNVNGGSAFYAETSGQGIAARIVAGGLAIPMKVTKLDVGAIQPAIIAENLHSAGGPAISASSDYGNGIEASAINTLGAAPSHGVGILASGGNWAGYFGGSGSGKVYVQDALNVGLGYSGSTAPVNGAVIQGLVGIGTDSPCPTMWNRKTMLHVCASDACAAGTYPPTSIVAGTIALLDGTGSTSPARFAIVKPTGWEILNFGGAGTSDEASVQYDPTSQHMAFRTNNVDNRIVIDGVGNVGIGLPTLNVPANQRLSVLAPTGYAVYGWSNDPGNAGYGIYGGVSGSGYGVYGYSASGMGVLGNGGASGYDFYGQGPKSYFPGYVGVAHLPNPSYMLYVGGNAWTTGTWGGSDMRWKKNVKELSGVIDKVKRLRGINYDWRKNEFPELNFSNGRQIGMVAQELEKEFPELVSANDQGYKAIAYDRFTAVLLEAIKEQQKEIESLACRVEALEKSQKK